MNGSLVGETLHGKIPWSLRLVVILSGLLLVAALFVPIWQITLYSNQYPDGLMVKINAQGFDAGGNGSDLTEINTLNHYIGMRPLNQADIPELKWIGTAIMVFAVLALAVGLLGRVPAIGTLLVLFGCFGAGSMWMFYSRLYEYGHTLDPRAAVKVPPFTPPLLGTQQLANFTVESYPDVGTYLMLGFALVIFAALLVGRWIAANAQGPKPRGSAPTATNEGRFA